MTTAQQKALALALTTCGGHVYTGHNINNGCRVTISAQTLHALARLGYMRTSYTTNGELTGQITGAGIEAIKAVQ